MRLAPRKEGNDATLILWPTSGKAVAFTNKRRVFPLTPQQQTYSMTSSEYALKLKDPRWQKKRLEVFQRAAFTCQECGSTEETLHAHHCWYIGDRDPWDYPDNCFRCLCESCHKERHEIEGDCVQQFRILMARNTSDQLWQVFFTLMEAVRDDYKVSISAHFPEQETILKWPIIINSNE